MAEQKTWLAAADYPSRRLNSNSSEIRLFNISPGTWQDETIVGSLEIVPLANQPVYDALSYTWGLSIEHHTIILDNDAGFPVTDNLYDALRRLRMQNAKRRVWIDAICINQLDMSEREDQVSRMSSIYASARRTIVWLGELENKPTSTWKIMRIEKDGEKHVSHSLSTLWTAVNNTRPSWWKRAWTVQEYLMSQLDPLFIFGPFELEAADIAEGPTFAALRFLSSAFSSFSRAVYALRRLKSSSGAGVPPSLTLLELRLLLSDVQATQPQDCIYGLLGLLKPAVKARIDINYKLTADEVFAKAIFAEMLGTKSLAVLWLTGNTDAGRPSWITPFERNLYRCSFTATYEDVTKVLQAPASSMPVQTEAWGMDRSWRYLYIRGLHCDTVKSVVSLSLRGEDRPAMLKGITEGLLQMPDCPSWSKESHIVQHAKTTGASLPERAAWKYSVLAALESTMSDERRRQSIESPEIADLLIAWDRCFCAAFDSIQVRAEEPVAEAERLVDTIGIWLWYITNGLQNASSLFVTDAGFLGLCWEAVAAEDQIVLFDSLKAPAILRRKETGVKVCEVFHGFAYVHGLWSAVESQRQRGHDGLESRRIVLG